jgi:hypothetical protein
MYTCTHTYMYIYTYTHIHTYVRTRGRCGAVSSGGSYTCIHTYIHGYIHTCIHTYKTSLCGTKSRWESYMYAYIHTYIHTYKTPLCGTKSQVEFLYMCTYIHTYIHIRRHCVAVNMHAYTQAACRVSAALFQAKHAYTCAHTHTHTHTHNQFTRKMRIDSTQKGQQRPEYAPLIYIFKTRYTN